MPSIEEILEAKKKAKQISLVDDLAEEIEQKRVSETGLSKFLGHLGILYNIPQNIAYNVAAESKGLPKVGLLDTHLEFSDAVEAFAPEARENDSWRFSKPLVNVLAPIALDASTYVTAGAGAVTKTGKVAKLAKVLGTIEDGGKTVVNLSKAKKFPTIFKKLKALGYVDEASKPLKVMEAVAPTKSGRILQGYEGIVNIFGKTPFKKQQAKVADVVSDATKNFFTGNSEIAKIIRQKGLHNVATYVRNNTSMTSFANHLDGLHNAPHQHFRRAFKDFQEDAKLIDDWVMANRGKNSRIASKIDGSQIKGLSKKEVDDIVMVRQYGIDAFDEEGRIVKTLERVGENGQVEKVGDHIVYEADKAFLNEAKKLTKQLSERRLQSMKQAERLKEITDNIGYDVFYRDNYFRQMNIEALKGKKGIRMKAVSKPVEDLINTFSGSGRNWKGASGSILDAEYTNAYAKQALTSKDFDDYEKIALTMLRDGRFRKSGNTIEEIYKLGASPNMRKMKQAALEANDQSLFEFYVSAETLAKDLDKMRRSKKLYKVADSMNTTPQAVFDKIKKVNASDVMERAKGQMLDEMYVKDIPFVDTIASTETKMREKSARAFESMITEGLDSGEVIAVKADVNVPLTGDVIPEGFTPIDMGAKSYLRPQKVQELLDRGIIDASRHTSGSEYIYAIRSDIAEVMKNSEMSKWLSAPESAIDGNAMKFLGKYIKEINNLWKATTLFPFPAYYVRNTIDNFNKVVLESNPIEAIEHMKNSNKIAKVIASGEWIDDVKSLGDDAQEIMNKVVVTGADGKKYKGSDIAKILDDFNIIGNPGGKHGILTDNPIKNFRERLTEMGLYNGQRKQVLDAMESVKGEGESVFATAERKIKNFKPIEIMMKQYELNETSTRIAVLMANLKRMDFDSAIGRTKIVNIDYNRLSPFERQIMNNVFAFYGFRKGTMKYVADTYMRKPWLIKGLASAPKLLEELIQQATPEEDTRLNPSLMPDYLQKAAVQFGRTDDGRYRTVNLRPLVSQFDAMINLVSPLEAAQESVMPIFKVFLETFQNKDWFTKQPLERFAGEKELLLGIPVPKANPIYQFVKNIRAINAFQDVVESALKDTDVSMFGTKEKKALFGLSRTAKYDPKTWDNVLQKYVLGVPVTDVDPTPMKLVRRYEQKRKKIDIRSAIGYVARKYKNDPETVKKKFEQLKEKAYNLSKDSKYKRLSSEGYRSK
jgi:hypothetical protein